MNANTYYYYDAPCGVGKTYNSFRTIVNQGGRHIFVVDRREVMPERVRLLEEIALEAGRPITTKTIFSGDDRKGIEQGVRDQVESLATSDLPADYVAIITHEAMRMSSFEDFEGQGWLIWIDEVPDILDKVEHSLLHVWPLLEGWYDLEPVNKKWSSVTLREGADVTLATLAQDDAIQMLRPFHRRVEEAKAGMGRERTEDGKPIHFRRTVLADIQKWSDLDYKRRDLVWFSLWSPLHVRYFDRVTFLANAFTHSSAFKIMRAVWPSIEWQALPIRDDRTWVKRRVFIHYYAEDHEARRSYFDDEDGRENLRAVAADISKRVPAPDHIFMGHDREDEVLAAIRGTRLSPKKAGTNAYAHITHASCLYTVKADNPLRTIYHVLGVDPHQHTVSSEYEVILQFMCRTSIRNPDDGRDVHLTVYDRAQAAYLLDYFDRDPRGYVSASLELHDLGFAGVARCSTPGRKPKRLTPAEQAQKLVDDRIRDAARKAKKRAADKLAESQAAVCPSI